MDEQWFAENLTRDPTILFRIFRYPPTLDQVHAAMIVAVVGHVTIYIAVSVSIYVILALSVL